MAWIVDHVPVRLLLAAPRVSVWVDLRCRRRSHAGTEGGFMCQLERTLTVVPPPVKGGTEDAPPVHYLEVTLCFAIYADVRNPDDA